MNRFKIFILLGVLAFSSCKKDNYDGPTAGLSGNFLDATTNELVEQDIIRGTTIEIIEHGYNPVQPQYLVVKNNGTYDNTLLFANTYTVKPVRGNFIAVDPQDVVIKGQTKLDFKVTPFIRLKNVSIVKTGSKVVAKFRLEQATVNTVRKIGLYAHTDERVGEPMRLVATEQTLNAVTNPNQEYTVEIDIPSNNSILKGGADYFFRVGALSSAAEAKLNYAPAVKISL